MRVTLCRTSLVSMMGMLDVFALLPSLMMCEVSRLDMPSGGRVDERRPYREVTHLLS